ncbi:NUDIX domain-containing protein [Deinococcus sp. NW-56]|uniref:NUDIX domain-containing protein n=1 Tax=Deinococcus sp. NW-56 TaxID=2080419 RepID=UPI000CF44D0B|nr:NUDIX domain-containing protein [Deinococcus sp. NW-56]
MTAPAPSHRFGVYIGRFQPPHTAHLRVMVEALENVGTLVVVIGSAHAPRTLKNPWTAGERQEVIGAMLREAGVDPARVRFAAVPDHPYDEDRWLAAVRAGVAAHTGEDGDVALIGHLKDDSSYYLRSFPDWPFLPTAVVSPLSATDVRRAYFAGELESVAGMVPPAVHAWLEAFRGTPEFAELEADAAWLRAAQAEAGTWPPLRVEALAAVRDPAGRVLLTRRDERPGRGLLALPGSEVLPSETLAAAARRAAAGALGVTPDDPALTLSPTPATVYDAPGRSPRGRVIAHVFGFEWTGATGAKEWTSPRDALAHPEAYFEDTHALLEQALSPAGPR